MTFEREMIEIRKFVENNYLLLAEIIFAVKFEYVLCSSSFQMTKKREIFMISEH